MVIDQDVTAEVKGPLAGAAYLLKHAVRQWIPELGDCFNITLTVAQRDAVLVGAFRQNPPGYWSEWQPIETAPEGVAILLFDEEWEATLGEIQIGYKNGHGRFLVDACPDFNPTHWQPLPPGPTAGQE